MTPANGVYPATPAQLARMRGLPDADRYGFPDALVDWQGRRVAVWFTARRRSHTARSIRSITYGVLSPCDLLDHLAVRLPDGTVKIIDFNRVHAMWLQTEEDQ